MRKNKIFLHTIVSIFSITGCQLNTTFDYNQAKKAQEQGRYQEAEKKYRKIIKFLLYIFNFYIIITTLNFLNY